MQYVIGDVHGCLKTLKALLALMKVKPSDKVVFVGDLIDRGPRIKGTLDFVMKMPNAVVVRGNHEQLMLDVFQPDSTVEDKLNWFYNGGNVTESSFKGEIPPKYFNFMKKMPLFVKLDKFYVAHGGMNSVNPERTNPIELMWSRHSTFPLDGVRGRKLVVGHTVKPMSAIKRSLSSGVIYIDNGCVFRGMGEMGSLCGLRLDDMELFSVKNQE